MSQPKTPWICQKCQAENDPDFTHCRMCGEKHPDAPPVEVACASCGTKHPGGSCCPLCGSLEFLQL
ncbi:hypothetical protein DVDV_0711 [Desulfovibrio sp. DV]|uniref:hypothetical protein n=1 Tax=Desulfovibrio sp. DV TaxID=1844708 RepID=UPI00094B8474|nr:hypothetical protein [Desulfovibrio sp. DV]OLN30301.1 hypothetical protein DVDV_0711 [Desulfovibrio sp. DV]